jgi:hypothetical protein
MNCPKCDGGAYVSEEEVVNVLESTSPVKAIVKIAYICKSCGERFSRVYFEDVEGRKKAEEKETKTKTWKPAPGMPTSEFAAGGPLIPKAKDKEPMDTLKFLDDV